MPSSINAAPTTMARPAFDPKALLNPKAASRRGNDPKSFNEPANPYSADMPDRSISDTSSPKRSNPDGDNISAGLMLERLHGVSKREDRPQKRIKKDHGIDEDGEDLVDARKKAEFSGGGKGGELGAYIKEKREEGKAETIGVKPENSGLKPVNNGVKSENVIDLTDGKSSTASPRLRLIIPRLLQR